MPLATYFVYPPVCICLKDRSYLWKQVRVLSLCAVHQLGPAQHFIFVFPTHTAFARLFVRLLCRFCWVILRGVTHYCTPPSTFSTFLCIIMQVRIRPGKRQVGLTLSFLMIASDCFMHASALTQRFLLRTMLCSLTTSLRRHYLFLFSLLTTSGNRYDKSYQKRIFLAPEYVLLKKTCTNVFLFEKYIRLLQHVSNISYNHLQEVLIYKKICMEFNFFGSKW